MLQLNKKKLSLYIKKLLSNLDISYNIWLKHYYPVSENYATIDSSSLEELRKCYKYPFYFMNNYSIIKTENGFEQNAKIANWDCGTICSRLAVLLGVFVIKGEYLSTTDTTTFSYNLFCRDIFTPIFNADVILSDLSDKQIYTLITILDNIDTKTYYRSEYIIVSFKFIWNLLFSPSLNGSKEELLENYPVVVNTLNRILESLKD